MRRLLFSIALMLSLPTMAGERSEQQILDAAASVLCGQPKARSLNAKGQQTLHFVQRRAAVTIVGADGGGFALVSNDDNQRPVLGYSREGTFDAKGNLPSGLKWYLNALDENLTEQSPSRAAIKPGDDVKPSVEPLIQTDWWQVAPYNDWLPTYVDANGVTRHFYTGCAMTAAAQLMYYYKYPDKPHGQITYSYDHFEDGHPVEVSCDLDTITFDWNRMAVRYNDRRSDDEQENIEVARLFMAIDNAWYAQYRPNGTTNGINYLYPFSNNFDYCHDCRAIKRDNYDDRLWMSMIFEELNNGHPIIYRGEPSSPDDDAQGHVFIVDGYDANGLIHINWGWGRVRGFDGYFSIDALVPNNLNHDFTAVQRMFIHIRPEGEPLSFKEFVVSQPGTLGSLLGDNPRYTRLKVSGQLNAADLQVLRLLGQQVWGSDSLIISELTHLDLSEATLPDNMLPDSAFCDCRQLLQLTLPAGLQRIGSQAFRNCTSLMQLQLPSGVTDIGSFAFLNCINLITLTLPRSLTTLSPSAFGGTIRLESFGVEEGNSHFATIDGILTDASRRKLVAYPEARAEAVIPASIDTIGSYAFYYCTKLKGVHVPSNVKVISSYAFISSQNLATVTFDEGVQRILGEAFNNCDALTTIHLPATIDSIGRRLFVNCDNMQQVTMSDQNLNFRVVNNCLLSHDGKQLVQALLTETETVGIPASVETINEFALYWMNITRLTLPSTLRKVGRQSIYSCKKLTQLDIEEGLEEIESYAFNGCSALREVHLPASLKTVGYGIFINCTGLNHVDISEASSLFRTDDNMLFSKDGTRLLRQLADDKEDYTVPTTVTAIDQGCFRNLNNLRRLTIPEGVTSIGNYVLYGCKALTDVYCQASIPLRLGNYVFDLTDLSQVTLHVPEGSRYAYSVSTSWNQFGNIVDDLPYTPPSVDYYLYHNTFNVRRSSQTAFTKLVVLAPCPQSNEYQEVHSMDYTSDGVWLQHEMQTNQNKYLELCMNGSDLASVSQDFSVGYSFTLTHKNIFIDFSPYKNADGSWKEMPAYDTSQTDYIDNTKQSGDYVVPDNSTIKSLSDQLFSECGNNRLAYAEKCYEYVASHFKYLNPGTGLHTLADILSAGGGDCGNLSSIYISLLRAKGIPARHVVAISVKADNKGYSGHVWSEFYIQDFGWVPVDVSHKNGNPSGNYFGTYDGKYIVVQKGVVMDYPTNSVGIKTISYLQLFAFWYRYSTKETITISQDLSSQQIETQKGDANGDGKVSVTDIAVIVNHILSIPNDAGFSVAGGDANGDGKITVTDIGVIVDIILGNNASARKTDVLEPQ